MSCVFLIVANVNCSWVKELDDKEMKDVKDAKIFSVKEAQQTFSAVPVIVVVNIAFNLCYNSMDNAFPSQACQMDLRIGKGQLNGAFFNIADAIAIVVVTPIFESCLYPMVARMKGSNVRLGQKIIAGLIIACISNLSAAVLEIYRKQAPALCDAGFSQCAPGYDDGISGTRMRDISAFWIFIPFALVGIAGFLVNPCVLERQFLKLIAVNEMKGNPGRKKRWQMHCMFFFFTTKNGMSSNKKHTLGVYQSRVHIIFKVI